MSLGQKGSGDPGAMLTSLLNKREKLRQDLRSIEKQVYELETSYLQESSHIGNALKGFEGFLSSSKSTASAKRSRKFQPEDRVFSLSSVTSPAAEELGVGREDGRAELGPGRSKGGLSTGQLVSQTLFALLSSYITCLYRGKTEERERTRSGKRCKEKQTIRTRL
ncbi:chromatin modification-related protein MEAF6 isoform X2 [Brassica rapa]|uniref:chromatin modification-related protein MEAF6 isoform X2 n=1 Tax=Brassica campestris TaxID=3711 RepID=UPI000BBF29E0|nr:chromatin modification-related protein MEAF6 isoform X2 [Brassica rapa]XP_048634007.1 chromatin modification-related protein MEAF6 isoform X2 [Brassica napus]